MFAYGEPAEPRRARPEDERHRDDAAGRARLARATRRAGARCGVIRAGDWPSGLYFLRLTASDGRVGYAPFIVRPRGSATRRVAVVLATNTWQAYNFDDADGDGWGDSWYVERGPAERRPARGRTSTSACRSASATGTSTFIAWLNAPASASTSSRTTTSSASASGDALARAYDLVVFPGHEEYVTTHAYDVIAALPRPRRQPDVPRGEQLLLARRARRAAAA